MLAYPRHQLRPLGLPQVDKALVVFDGFCVIAFLFIEQGQVVMGLNVSGIFL